MDETTVTKVRVNGRLYTRVVEPRLSLADFLRNEVGLTGTQIGCEQGFCGACTVILEGDAIKSCLMLAVQADNREISTVEGLSEGNTLDMLQVAFREHHAVQCGYCTPGILMAAKALLSKHDQLDAGIVRRELSGNLCRCTGYTSIVQAVLAVADRRERNG